MLSQSGRVDTSHWLIDFGWLSLMEDEALLQQDNAARCVGSKAPKMVDGNVVIQRCGRILYIPESWTVVTTSTSSPFYLLCYQHEDQHEDFVRMYEALRAGN